MAVGAVFGQLVVSVWQLLAFFSRQLHPPELKYSTFDWQYTLLSGTSDAILQSCPFTAYTDHKQLCLERHLSVISEFSTTPVSLSTVMSNSDICPPTRMMSDRRVCLPGPLRQHRITTYSTRAGEGVV